LAACLLLPLVVHAAGLGRLALFSSLGEPLRAEVEIVALQPGDEDSLAARLASAEAFRLAGIEYNPTLLTIRVALERRDGKPLVRLTSVQPINDPFVDLLLELQWSTGRLVREYTFLLDPPGYREKPSVAAAPGQAQAVAPAATPSPRPAPVEARPLVAEPGGAQTYEVRKGDTLGRIARENKSEGVTLYQMLVALYRANPDAFIKNNINLVRAGRILKIPDREAAASVATTDANRLVQAHMAEFAEYRAKLAAAVAARPATAAPGQREVAGRITAKPETPPSGAAKDQLRLSKADVSKPATPSARAAREDDKIAANRALQEAQSRVTDLEKNVTDLQKLLEMKNKQLAQLEQIAGAKPAAAPPAAAPEAAKPAAAPQKPAAEAAKPAAEAPKPAAETPKPAAAAPKPAPEAAKALVPEKPKPKQAPPPPEPSLLDGFLDNPLALGGLGAVVVLLAGYGTWAWRRKRAAQSRVRERVLGASGAAALAMAGTGAQQTATAAAVAAAIAAAPPGVAAAEGDDVDPIAEADVYLAYGRDAQAEEILNEGLGKHPNRVALHAKLLEVFAHRHDTKAFAQTALAIKGLTAGTGPDWDKARKLGRSIDPENDLYGGGGAAVESPQPVPQAGAAPTPAVDFDLGGGAAGSGEAPGAEPAAASLDFDIGATTIGGGENKTFSPDKTVILQPERVPSASASRDIGPGADTGDGKKGEASLDFDLGALEPPAPPPASPAPPESTGSLDFDLNLDLGGAKPSTAPDTAAAPAPLDITTISLDLGKPAVATPATSSDPKWQEVATKLDLAKAYQERGDKDGARELLDEVIHQGDAAQQNEAKQMLAALG